MGQVRTIPQSTQEGGQSGQVSLEITYGGKESPFGGIDSSAPPAYIDPKCFSSSDGFFISDNQVDVATWQTFPIPVLWAGIPNVKLLKMGTFYNSIYGDLNYALGLTVGAFAGPPTGKVYTFYMSSWNYIGGVPTIIGDVDRVSVKIYDVVQAAVSASLTIYLAQGEEPGFVDSGDITVNCYNLLVPTTNVSQHYVPGNTLKAMVSGLVSSFNANTLTTLFSAVATEDGTGIILTANTPGNLGNSLAVNDVSASTTVGNTPAFYFPLGFAPTTPFLGGKDSGIVLAPSTFNNPSTVDVGGTLYIANIGPVVLKYSGPGAFSISSIYSGYNALGKFAGSLIGLGSIPALFNIVNDSDMIFSWTAANKLDEWNPLTAAGLVTGAGFTQLDDIGDKLTNLIVSNNTAFILRSQGVSYATSLGGGSVPFSFAHIGLGQEGEGAQNSLLVCQYNETGAFVGNSNIFKISGQITQIGDKIASNLFTALATSTGPVGAAACQVSIGKRFCVVAAFLIGSVVYLYNTENGTWMEFSYTGLSNDAVVSLAVLSGFNSTNAVEKQTYLCLVAYSPSLDTKLVYALQEGYTNPRLTISPPPQITFPQEELVFGRDVVIGAIYFSMNATATLPNNSSAVQFYFNNILFSEYDLEPPFWNSLAGNPVEVPSYPSTVGVFTSHSPQLTIKVPTANGIQVRFSKIQIYASMEPEQRPVS